MKGFKTSKLKLGAFEDIPEETAAAFVDEEIKFYDKDDQDGQAEFVFNPKSNIDIEATIKDIPDSDMVDNLVKTLSEQTKGKKVEVHRVDVMYDLDLLLPSRLDGTTIDEYMLRPAELSRFKYL